jgi:tyrosyl-tRNA synthetase
MLSREEIGRIMEEHLRNPRERMAQTRLAQETTKLVHGDAELTTAEVVTQVLTGKLSVSELDDAALKAFKREMPAVKAGVGTEIADVLVETGLASSKTEARRFLFDSAISVNGEKTTKQTLDATDFQNSRLLLRRGKAFKDSALVELA